MFLKMLPGLSKHYKNNPDSLLSKIFGVFTVKTRATSSVHLMLMENVLQIKNPEGLRYIFDLKGSLVDRKVKGKTKPSTTLKDVNYLMATAASPNFISLEEPRLKNLAQIVRKDVRFLSDLGLMDYSLLLAIETLESGADTENGGRVSLVKRTDSSEVH